MFGLIPWLTGALAVATEGVTFAAVGVFLSSVLASIVGFFASIITLKVGFRLLAIGFFMSGVAVLVVAFNAIYSELVSFGLGILPADSGSILLAVLPSCTPYCIQIVGATYLAQATFALYSRFVVFVAGV